MPQECSPDGGPGARAAAGMCWQYGRDVAEQLEATRAAVADAVGQLRAPARAIASMAAMQQTSVSMTSQRHRALMGHILASNASCDIRQCKRHAHRWQGILLDTSTVVTYRRGRACSHTLSRWQEPTDVHFEALMAENAALRTRAEHLQGRCLDDLAPAALCDLINTLTGVRSHVLRTRLRHATWQQLRQLIPDGT